jgi:hypothetical protein
MTRDAGVVIEYMPNASTKDPVRPDFFCTVPTTVPDRRIYAHGALTVRAFEIISVNLWSNDRSSPFGRCRLESVIYRARCTRPLQKLGTDKFSTTDYSRGRPTTQEKAVYYNLKPNSRPQTPKIPAVIDVSKIKEDKKKLKIRETEGCRHHTSAQL